MSAHSLKHQGHPLAVSDRQLQILEGMEPAACPAFDETLRRHGLWPLQADALGVLQINVGKLCNQVCRHCHVDAGPDRREVMSRETLQECLAAVDCLRIQTVDLTGGAPEMNPHFRWFVAEVRSRGVQVLDRCNLTILLAPGFDDLPEFLARNQVDVIASLPCYLEENCDRQRGEGVYQKSISALRRLNQLGYGQPDSGLKLSLVYNPLGPSLPPSQSQLELAYKEQLRALHGIEFNSLYTITNMPISRFLEDLVRSGRYVEYMDRLTQAFNPQAVPDLMCRSTLSVDWQGYLYDCDFNQMLGLRVDPDYPQHIRDLCTGAQLVEGS